MTCGIGDTLDLESDTIIDWIKNAKTKKKKGFFVEDHK